ncbi:MAG: hypothetical protein CM1200mP18_14320 [Gammaproteobacteria bacterium]|nr:MAG: hypothetical protein CM1200mP18_14320 [Gammaproteobacteria bacterium]
MFADLWWEGRPYKLCPRSALKRTIQNVADQGYAVYAGVEPEFFVMKWEDGQPVKASTMTQHPARRSTTSTGPLGTMLNIQSIDGFPRRDDRIMRARLESARCGLRRGLFSV